MKPFVVLACVAIANLVLTATQAQTTKALGEITFKNGSTQKFTEISDGYSRDTFYYLEAIDDLPNYQHIQSPSVRQLALLSISTIEFVDLTKDEKTVVDQTVRKFNNGYTDTFRKANVLLRNGKRLEEIFLPFGFGYANKSAWSDGSISGSVQDPKIVKIVFAR